MANKSEASTRKKHQFTACLLTLRYLMVTQNYSY